MIPQINIKRDIFTRLSSSGKMFDECGEFFCYTLEDEARPKGVKIKSHTCLAPGLYKVKVTYSSRFKRLMPIIYTEPNGYEAKMGGISFKGSRLHGGNTHLNTEGCPLVAYNRINSDKIYKTAEKALTKKIQELIEVSSEDYIHLLIENLPYNG